MKKNKKEQASKNDINNPYDLKVNAVDDLVDVLKQQENNESSKEENKKIPKGQPNPYKIDKLARIPTWIKACFTKFWVAGAICYFFFWGLGIYITNMIDLVVLTGIATGIITDLLVNSAFMYFQSDKKEYNKYILLPVSCKKVWTFFVNIPYAIIEVLIIFFIYSSINQAIVIAKDLPEGSTPLGVEPLLYGLLFLLIDMAFISCKNLLIKIIKDAKTNSN